ncbi:monovalent cation/H+ antiporter complex subunit F [Allostreptomyces psammosilenae]|uniref:Multicomponent Na+:H+ antiporter subunit F n=1 Tax=Allostreptomyces psammosilenae TaxID=1892865 RepID=A0A852ZS61_9ACTN|nr:monovalent cation/H+ antiporter complex subunit F [Allostreptomyces psammosilenae]NYI04307.1 multicomponent Na+:H+ antiporter subunit F [Allostreptomyces psammosilenae]
MEAVYAITGALLSVAALLTLVRIGAGPSTLDRIVAIDVLLALVACGVAVWAARSGQPWSLVALVVVTLISFVGSVAVSRLVIRRHR